MNCEQKCSHNLTKVTHLPKVNNLDSLNKICRICYENEIPMNKIVAPCKCKGSIKFIHVKCLKKWIRTRQCEHKYKKYCEICGYKFTMKRSREKTTIKKFCKTLCCLKNTDRVYVQG